ncbi:Uncharacterised protein [Klebsiella michiganensis]|nr:Uncharacterised protein [Klebsiella michiganensis]
MVINMKHMLVLTLALSAALAHAGRIKLTLTDELERDNAKICV